MLTHALLSLSPLDGRYKEKLSSLAPLLSEHGLIYFRCFIEIHWLIHLSSSLPIPAHIPPLTDTQQQQLLALLQNFDLSASEAVKAIEKKTNHDVKAIEYFLAEKLSDYGLSHWIPWLHFGCTSEDINNLAYALMFKSAEETVLMPLIADLMHAINRLATETQHLPMLSRTHGQAASPTLLGKEILNFAKRLERQVDQLDKISILGKMNGAVGNFNAHAVAYPQVDWLQLSKQFVQKIELTWNPYTTQIEPHDWIAEKLHCFMRLNTILLDFSRDIWGYIALHYFTQKSVKDEVGSSTMPHKINPIDFENAEGNLGMANAISQHFCEKLPISRWQRDLSDSTVLRNLGTLFGHNVLAYQALIKGIQKLSPNPQQIYQELQAHPEVLAEAIQSVMRSEGIADAYEQLKAFSRGKAIDATALQNFIETLPLSEERKRQLSALKPENYLGCSTQYFSKHIK